MLQPVQVRSGQAAIQAFMGMADIDQVGAGEQAELLKGRILGSRIPDIF